MNALLDARNVVGARGGRRLFGPLDLTLPPGGAFCVTGPNGAGKSTLLRILAGLLSPHSGEIRMQAACRYLGHHDAVKPALTVAENLAFWRRFGGGDPTLETMDLAALADLPARYLSAGQRRRLSLSRALDPAAPVWLLDEPVNALDAASIIRLEEALAAHRQHGGAIVVVSHATLRLPDARAIVLGAP
jgi:heme exporter protein A